MECAFLLVGLGVFVIRGRDEFMYFVAFSTWPRPRALGSAKLGILGLCFMGVGFGLFWVWAWNRGFLLSITTKAEHAPKQIHVYTYIHICNVYKHTKLGRNVCLSLLYEAYCLGSTSALLILETPIYIYIHIYIQIYIYMCVYIYIFLNTGACAHALICNDICVYVDAQTYKCLSKPRGAPGVVSFAISCLSFVRGWLKRIPSPAVTVGASRTTNTNITLINLSDVNGPK